MVDNHGVVKSRFDSILYLTNPICIFFPSFAATADRKPILFFVYL